MQFFPELCGLFRLVAGEGGTFSALAECEKLIS
jgi:hypothetical protein